MPTITMNYDGTTEIARHVRQIGLEMRAHVAKLMSTKDHHVIASDFDWFPRPHPVGTLAPTVSIEIEVIGYPQRKEAVTLDAVIGLRRSILSITNFPLVSCNPLISIKFIDPAGYYL